MNKVVLYSNDCPRCKVLKSKLDSKKIKYETINDIDIMKSKGFYQVPMLEVGDKIMDFVTSNNWINSYTL